jgi:hypothetical protein
MADTKDIYQSSFSTENDQVDDYRQVSRLAICSIPLGLISALALIGPLMWFLPLVAVAIAAAGLRQVSRSKELTGRRMALIGLALAILFGTWGVTWTVSRRMVINRQARAHASEWLGLMQEGENMRAHQLTLSVVERLPLGSSLQEYYFDDPEESDYEEDGAPKIMNREMLITMEFKNFQENGIPGLLVDADGDFEFTFVENKSQIREGPFSTKVNQVFRLKFSDEHVPREMDVRIEMRRILDNQKAYWQVGPTTDENKSS